MNRKRGPPTSNVPTSGKFENRGFSVRNTRPRTGDLAAANVSMRGAASSMMVKRASRPSSVGKVLSYMNGVPYNDATTQLSEEHIQPRVFYQKQVQMHPLLEKDFNSNGFIVFFSNDPRRQRAKDYAEKHALTPVVADAYLKRTTGAPLEAVFMNVPALINLELAEEPAPLEEVDMPMPSPKKLMRDHFLWGIQNNQTDGQEVRGTDNYSTGDKMVNPVIFGDADGYDFWGDAPEHAVLWLVIQRFPRAELERHGHLDFYLNPNSNTRTRPGERLTARNKAWRGERPNLCKNPCRMYSAWTLGGEPDVSASYDDNGFYSEPHFIKIGRRGYTQTQPKGKVSVLKMFTDNREVLRAAKINMSFVPSEH